VYGRETTWPKSARAFLDLANAHVRSAEHRRKLVTHSPQRGAGA
jgi:hypothetical protein